MTNDLPGHFFSIFRGGRKVIWRFSWDVFFFFSFAICATRPLFRIETCGQCAMPNTLFSFFGEKRLKYFEIDAIVHRAAAIEWIAAIAER